jgi:hypothetical protein
MRARVDGVVVAVDALCLISHNTRVCLPLFQPSVKPGGEYDDDRL